MKLISDADGFGRVCSDDDDVQLTGGQWFVKGFKSGIVTIGCHGGLLEVYWVIRSEVGYVSRA